MTGSYQGIAKTRYVNDKQITDHYAIIPTGQGFGALGSLKGNGIRCLRGDRTALSDVFFIRRSEFAKITMVTAMQDRERFFYSFRVLLSRRDILK